MVTLFGNIESGNVHKVQMILARRGLPFRLVDTKQVLGQPRDPRFLALNPMGKVPTILFEDGDILSDSGAILRFFAEGTELWPISARGQAEVLRWMFFEQYNHEPSLAVLRYLKHFTDEPSQHRDRIAELEPKARFALDAMETRLARADWIAAPAPTIADYALYPYTRWADQSGFNIAEWPAISRWFERVEDLPDFLPLDRSAAQETIAFETYLAGKT